MMEYGILSKVTMPAMLRANSYDTLCHEHLEFYSLKVVKNLLEKNGLKMIEVQTNDINGGSFAITAAKKESGYACNDAVINWMLNQEKRMGSTPAALPGFCWKNEAHKESLNELIHSIVAAGKTIFGYGASTKCFIAVL